ncbi:hypothetical protein [Rhizobium mongolense]|uniref:Uncharacterized protein n=1 Tax=Rhizobium mongolense TaxID=57676 RepID=A0A7W6RIB6_9HYPH|nr:hypothetical protein [Rhizobium mongolense]MBB4272995.1 hypothetical protein [Rhizobium mongolense]
MNKEAAASNQNFQRDVALFAVILLWTINRRVRQLFGQQVPAIG